MRMAFPTSTYIAGATGVHACDARVKIVLLLAYSIAIFWVDTWPGMAVFALLVALVWAGARLPVARVIKPLVFVFVLAAFTVLFNVIPPTWEGLSRGLFFAARMILLVAASFMVCFTSTSTDLVIAFRQLISPLRALHVPVDDIALTLSLSIRFIPVIAEEFTQVRDAQALRGAHFSNGSVVERAKAFAGLFVPVFAGMFRRADALATSMDARCYGVAVPTRLNAHAFTAQSGAVLVVGLALMCATAALL